MSTATEATIKVDTVIGRAKQAMKNRTLPNHDAFTISEVLGACLGLPKEYVLDEMMKRQG
jgi:hypothetical protein